MSGTSAEMCHFGVAEVMLCAWADGSTTISFPESSLPLSSGTSNGERGTGNGKRETRTNTTKTVLVPRASILSVSVGDREGDALETRMH